MARKMVKAALRAARRGWPVLPLHYLQDGRCSCGRLHCPSAGKHPLTARGVHDATIDEAIIRNWWKRSPKANVGIATGRKSGLLIFDVDPRHGGAESLGQLGDQWGPFPHGPILRTGSGGRHLYFQCPDFSVGNRVAVRPGLDVRGDGGYAVYAGSQHQSGQTYRFIHGHTPSKLRVPPCPEFLLDLLRESKSPRSYAAEDMIEEGERNDALASIAGSLRHRGLGRDAIEAALLGVNSVVCDPPLSPQEVNGIAKSIASYPAVEAKILSAHHKEVEGSERILHFCSGEEVAARAPEEIPWIAESVAAAGAITDFVGKVKLGKSTFLNSLISSVINARSFLGKSTTATNVVCLSETNPVAYRAALERADLLGRSEISTLFWCDAIGCRWDSIIRQAVDECARRKARLLVVDTLPQFAGLVGDSENHAGDALKALRPLQEAAAAGLAVISVRHERKSGGALGDSGRGSSAFAGGVDIVLSLRDPGGNQPRNVRLLQSVSRFDSPGDVLIRLNADGYELLGTPGESLKKNDEERVLNAIRESANEEPTIQDLMVATGEPRARLQRVLTRLMKKGSINRLGHGAKGSPHRYRGTNS